MEINSITVLEANGHLQFLNRELKDENLQYIVGACSQMQSLYQLRVADQFLSGNCCYTIFI